MFLALQFLFDNHGMHTTFSVSTGLEKPEEDDSLRANLKQKAGGFLQTSPPPSFILNIGRGRGTGFLDPLTPHSYNKIGNWGSDRLAEKGLTVAVS